jgi:hypothetical protein
MGLKDLEGDPFVIFHKNIIRIVCNFLMLVLFSFASVM